MRYQKDPVDILVLSKKGEEKVVKPIILFDQGSQARPLILLDNGGEPYRVFPFQTDSLLTKFHLAIVGKPYVPLIANHSDLKNGAYADPQTGIPPAQFYSRDNVDYYVNRAKEVIKHLKKQPWVKKDQLVAAGHSAGSTVVAKLALESKDVTHLIYSGGNPFGRMASIISQARATDDSVGTRAERSFTYWQEVVKDSTSVASQGGDSNKTTYDFSIPPIDYLMKLQIPVLVTYGTKDYGVAFNDYMRLETIRKGKKNFTFKPYIGMEHNYFGFDTEGKVDYDKFGWDQVADDWSQWLRKEEIHRLKPIAY
jgi:dienelactone hydrolase